MTPGLFTDSVTTDLDRALHYTALWGLEGIEVHAMGGMRQVVPHVDEEKLRRRLLEYDLPLAAVVPGLFEGPVSDRVLWLNEVTSLPETLGLCRRVGCSLVVVASFAAEEDVDGEACATALRQAGDVAAAEDVTLAVHNQPGGAHSDGESLAALLDAVDHPAVRATWDPAAAVRTGADPASGLAALQGRVAHVRCSDGVVDDGSWEPRPLDSGDVGWLDQLRMLRAQGFDGSLSLVVDVEPQKTYGLRAATRLIEMVRATADDG